MKNPIRFAPVAGRRAAQALSLALALSSAMGIAACNEDKLLTAPIPDVVQPGDIAGTAALGSAYAATVSDFQFAFGGANLALGGEGQVNMVGLLTDELFNAETFPTRIEVDKRATNPVNSTMLPIYQNLHRARHTAELVADRFATGDPANPNHAEVLALGAYTYVLFAENYCSGVPVSTVNPDGTFAYGAPMTTAELYAKALPKFDSAITIAAGAGALGTQPLNLARVGKGRALLDQGRFAEAAAAVSAVPTSFAYLVQHSANTPRQNNGVFSFMFAVKRFTVADAEGGNGLPFVSTTDPRIAPVRNGFGTDNVTPEFQTMKYQDRSSPTPLALGTEARLIEAEAALQAGSDALFLSKLNEARANAQTYAPAPNPPPGPLAPITTLPTSASGKQDLLFQERAFDMYLTSHRLGDMRRLIRQYGRSSETVFPTGPYPQSKGGGQYSTDVNFPIPFEETNNPNFRQCLDRNA
jgi:hypothetical protein